MYIVEDSVDAALRFLDRAEETINGLVTSPSSGAPFWTDMPELRGMRTKLLKDFPNHVVFYIERDDVVEVVRVLRGGQDMATEIEKT